MHPDHHPASPTVPEPGAAPSTLLALALLGFGTAIFADHIASYYLLQWAPTLRRYPSHEERMAVLQALTLDRAIHATMWLALAASLWFWRRAVHRREPATGPGRSLTWVLLGIASYAVLRVVVESQLAIHLVRVPNVELGIGWHGPGFALAGIALLATTLLVAATDRTPVPARTTR